MNFDDFNKAFCNDNLEPEHIRWVVDRGREDNKVDFKGVRDLNPKNQGVVFNFDSAASCVATAIASGTERIIILGVEEDKSNRSYNVEPIDLSVDNIISKFKGSLSKLGPKYESVNYFQEFEEKKHYEYRIVTYNGPKFVFVVKTINTTRLAKIEKNKTYSFPCVDGPNGSRSTFSAVAQDWYYEGKKDTEVNIIDEVISVVEKALSSIREDLNTIKDILDMSKPDKQGGTGLAYKPKDSYSSYEGSNLIIKIISIPINNNNRFIDVEQFKYRSEYRALYELSCSPEKENNGVCRWYQEICPGVCYYLTDIGEVGINFQVSPIINAKFQSTPSWFGYECNLYIIWHVLNYILRMARDVDDVVESKSPRVLQVEISIPLEKNGKKYQLQINVPCLPNMFMSSSVFSSVITKGATICSSYQYVLDNKDNEQIVKIIHETMKGLDRFFKSLGGIHSLSLGEEVLMKEVSKTFKNFKE